MLVSITELHNLTGFDRRKITKSVADLPHQSGDKGAKLYDAADALPLLYLGGDGKLDGSKERARLTHHQANIAALEERELKGELVRRTAVIEEVSEAIANCRAKLLSLPSKMAHVVVGVDSVKDVREVLQASVHDALDELHNQYVNHESGGEGLEVSAEADG